MNKQDLLIIKSANELRKSLGIGFTSPVDIRGVIKKTNIVTAFKPFDAEKGEEEFSGCSIRTEYGNFMMINSNHTIGRQNFTIAHELYHLMVQNDSYSFFCGSKNEIDSEEKKAQKFASSFLLPQEALIENLTTKEISKKNSIAEKRLFHLENYFQISRYALLIKLKILNIVDQSFIDRHNDPLSTAENYEIEKTLYLPGRSGEVWGDYVNLAEKLFREEKISESHYRELLSEIGSVTTLE